MKRAVYAALRAVSALDHRLRQRLTSAGWLALGAGLAALAAGLDTTQNASYQAATLLGALLGFAWASSLPFRFRARVTVERELPRFATAGEPFGGERRHVAHTHQAQVGEAGEDRHGPVEQE